MLSRKKRDEDNYYIGNNGFLDSGGNAGDAGTIAVDLECASYPCHLVACLPFWEGELEIEGPPDQHHHGDI